MTHRGALPSFDESHLILFELLKKENVEPILIGRLGTGEFQVIGGNKDCCMNVGISPATTEQMTIFKEKYINAASECDCMCVFCLSWFPNELTFVQKYSPRSNLCNALVAHNIWDIARRKPPVISWWDSLEDQKILIIHPFTESMQSQYKKWENIWPTANLPKFSSIQFVKVPLTQRPSHVLPPDNITWIEHLQRLQREVTAIDFDVALLGCGGYGMPLACYIKTELRKKAMYVGGSLQLLFGIRGKRWEADVAPYVNEYWVRPSSSEFPQCSSLIENGCYW